MIASPSQACRLLMEPAEMVNVLSTASSWLLYTVPDCMRLPSPRPFSLERPSCVEYLPVEHWSHPVEPDTVEYCPLVQITHVEAPSEDE